jgi:hypothetical protein
VPKNRATKDRVRVIENERKMKIYIEYMMNGNAVIIKPPSVPRIISTRACLHCGNSYQINIPYEDCVPGNRDLCDSCLIKRVKL